MGFTRIPSSGGQAMTIELGVLMAIISVLVGYLTYRLNSKRYEAKEQHQQKEDIEKDATKNAVIETKLDGISNGVDNIRVDLRANERQIGALGERVTRNEESTKQAHKRIDGIVGDNKSKGGE